MRLRKDLRSKPIRDLSFFYFCYSKKDLYTEGTVIFNVHTPFNSTPKKVISIYFVFYGALSCMTLNLLGLWLVQGQQREDL